MRNFKRFLAMTLTMLMVVGCFVLTSSAKFDDVSDFQAEIQILSDLGIIKGNADGTFGFDAAVTRRQEALFIARAKTGKVDDTVWSSKVNNSQFKDLDSENDYYGAISYCANLGIILGKTTTEYYPNDNILFQEALAMVVRAIGYGSEKMDAGYPYTYYDKAVSLGLDDGIENVALTDTVSRGVAAKLLYNAFFCVNADGSTMAADAFGANVKSATVVIVAANGVNLVGYNQPTAAGTVSFCEIKADGTFDVARVYNLNTSVFETLSGVKPVTCASYDVVTIDDYATLSLASANPTKTFDQDGAAGSTIDGHSYALVNRWSDVFNTSTTWSGNDELQKYHTAFAATNVAGVDVLYFLGDWYLVDEYNNILAKDDTHQILYYYMGFSDDGAGENDTWVNSYGTYYAKKTTAGLYVPVTLDATTLANAAKIDQLDRATYGVQNSSIYTTNVDSYSNTVAYDDDNDALYERAYFTYYIFGRYTETTHDNNTWVNFSVGAHGAAMEAGKKSDVAINNVSEKTLTNGAYVLWARNALTGVFTIKKIYGDPVKGYVTAVDMANKNITFSGLGYSLVGIYDGSSTVGYGVAQLPGATNTTTNGWTPYINDDTNNCNATAESLIGVSWDLQFQVIKYIVDEDRGGKIVAIVSETSAKTPIVVDSYQGFTTLGYLREQVVLNTGNLQIINISKINDYPLFTAGGIGYYNNSNQFGINTSPDNNSAADLRTYFTHAQLLVGSNVDQLADGTTSGNWMVFDENYNGEFYQYYARETNYGYNELYFYNAIAYENANYDVVETPFIGKIGEANGLTTDVFTYKADANTVIITPSSNDGFNVAKGIPANGAYLDIPTGSKIYVDGQYIYILPPMDAGEFYNYVEFRGFGASSVDNIWNTNANGQDIVWFDGYKNATIQVITNTGSLYNQYGFSAKYTSGYRSLLTGKANGDVAGAIYSDNAFLKAGWYYVKSLNLNGETVKAFDKAVTSEITSNNYTYISEVGKTYAYEILGVNGDGSVYYDVTRSEIVLKNYSATKGFDGDYTTAIGAGKALKVVEYLVDEYETNYIASAKKLYLVVGQVDLTAVPAIMEDLSAYTVKSNSVGITDVKATYAIVDGKLGYTYTYKLDPAYTLGKDDNAKDYDGSVTVAEFDADGNYNINATKTPAAVTIALAKTATNNAVAYTIANATNPVADDVKVAASITFVNADGTAGNTYEAILSNTAVTLAADGTGSVDFSWINYFTEVMGVKESHILTTSDKFVVTITLTYGTATDTCSYAFVW